MMRCLIANFQLQTQDICIRSWSSRRIGLAATDATANVDYRKYSDDNDDGNQDQMGLT